MCFGDGVDWCILPRTGECALDDVDPGKDDVDILRGEIVDRGDAEVRSASCGGPDGRGDAVWEGGAITGEPGPRRGDETNGGDVTFGGVITFRGVAPCGGE